MKRKFSFNLAPVKVPTKTETKVTKEKSPSHLPHRRIDSISPPPSPFINRRPLTPKTEQQLRNACALILQDFKPSGHVFEDQAKPKLDFDGLNKNMKEKGRTVRSDRQREPHSETSRVAHDARKADHRYDTGVVHESNRSGVQANTSRRRGGEQAHLGDKEQLKASQKAAKSIEHTKVVPIRTGMDTDDAESLQTPLTSSTENQLNIASTAPTSAAIASSRSSKRASHHYENPAAVADAAAAEWMKQELEKKRHLAIAESQAQSKAPSRSRSFRAGIKEYIFPGSKEGSRSVSRQASRASMRSEEESAEPKRSGSAHGWRSWSLQRKTSLSSFRGSRPSSSKGGSEEKEPEQAKPEINLNRELPPLPSLDTWDRQEQQKAKKESRKSAQVPGTHIANLMRPSGQEQQEHAAAVRRQHRRSGSDSLTKNLSRAVEGSGSLAPSRTIHTSSGPKSPSLVSPRHQQDPSLHSPQRSPLMSRQGGNDTLQPQGHKYTKSGASFSSSMKLSMDQNRNEPPNFSRKISTDIPRQAFPNIVEISGNAGTPKEEKSSKLRKVFSSWVIGSKKEKKNNWMDQMEQNNLKGGIMLQDETASAPVVKY